MAESIFCNASCASLADVDALSRFVIAASSGTTVSGSKVST